MDDPFLVSIAHFGVQFGLQIGGHAEPQREINPTALADAILRSAVAQASEIVRKLGIERQLDYQRGEFGLIVGVVMRELFHLAHALTGLELSHADCSLDAGETCVRAIMALTT